MPQALASYIADVTQAVNVISNIGFYLCVFYLVVVDRKDQLVWSFFVISAALVILIPSKDTMRALLGL